MSSFDDKEILHLFESWENSNDLGISEKEVITW